MGTVTSIDHARSVWLEELSFASRSSHRIEKDSPTVDLGTLGEASAAWDRLLDGDVVLHSELRSRSTIDLQWFGSRSESSERNLLTKGHRTLHITVGAIAISKDELLPIYLAPVVARRLGAQVDDWELALEECALAISVVSAPLLFDNWSIQVPPIPSSVSASQAAIAMLSKHSQQVGGPMVSGLATLGSVSCRQLAVIRDLKSEVLLEGSTLVRALTRDPAAVAAVRTICSVETSTEVSGALDVVLPCDTSRLEVIERVLGGSTMLVEGPPGCGKSQTIVNLIAALASAGRTVLLVTEKEGAADVIVDRLASVGLDRLVFDAHDPGRRLGSSDLAPLPEGALEATTNGAFADWAEGPTSKRHYELMNALRPRMAQLVRLGPGNVVDLGMELAEKCASLGPRLHDSLRRVAAFRDGLSESGVIVGRDSLLRLLKSADALDELVRALGRNQLGCSLRSARLAASSFGQLGQVAGEVDQHALVGDVTERTLEMNVRHIYLGSFDTPSVRNAIVGRVTEAVEQAATLGLARPTQTLGALFAALDSVEWSALTTLSDELWDALVRCDVGAASLVDLEMQSATRVINDMATAVALFDETSIRDADVLRSGGVLDALLTHPDPGEAIAAAITKSMLVSNGVLSGIQLDAEADDMERRVVSSRERARARMLMPHEHDANGVSDHSEIDLEGLVRRSRTSPVTVGDALRTYLDAVMRRRSVVVTSPWSLPQCLPVEPDYFDVVIFDEASQIETASAVPAVARARAAVRFGDSRQLPPQSFFRGGPPPDDDAILGQASLLDAFGSLLGGAGNRAALRWHYRSLDDTLINFVNDQPSLYDGLMITTPAAAPLEGATELRMCSEDLVADVRAIVEAVPGDQDVAILTMNLDLADVLSRRLGLGGVDDISNDGRVSVRNLERFQGDERDVVVLVLTTPTDGSSPPQSLGPINLPGGERHLNEAITRARRRLIVLSPYPSTALDAARTDGAKLLRAFLEFLENDSVASPIAHHGGHAEALVTAIAADLAVTLGSDFDVEVRPVDSPAGVRLAVHYGARVCGLDFDFADLGLLEPFDRQVVRRAELRRRGWSLLSVTFKEWVLDPIAVAGRVQGWAQGSSHDG